MENKGLAPFNAPIHVS